eukprot:MONOS_3135.1-p1 / transcript=MONOS_3135.1 / gene=MONOS_3135 / organism=Monocercomonoides_exilis_PA203 / gene_product=unspecified product / transcript_product=unspecified product / location=Mono_scaffold00071:51668-52224(-) / protein_length=94 / sequence_SO=supercontig / SO=protein_coding / is_pseudo=false
MNVVEIDFTVIGRGANDGSFVVLHHILINDCFCLDWLKWTLLAKEKGYMEQGYMSIWIGNMKVIREMNDAFCLQGEFLLRKKIKMGNGEEKSG